MVCREDQSAGGYLLRFIRDCDLPRQLDGCYLNDVARKVSGHLDFLCRKPIQIGIVALKLVELVPPRRAHISAQLSRKRSTQSESGLPDIVVCL